jgi:hypothetical protein
LFLREYAIGITHSPVIREVFAWTVSKLNDEDRQICEALSLFGDAIDPKILVRICSQDGARIGDLALAHLEASGLIDSDYGKSSPSTPSGTRGDFRFDSSKASGRLKSKSLYSAAFHIAYRRLGTLGIRRQIIPRSFDAIPNTCES